MRLVLMLALLAPLAASAQGTGTLAGQVLEADSITAVIGANVRVSGTTLGAATDIDGKYRIIGVPVGSYTVTASYQGYQSQSIQGVEINTGSTRQLDFTFTDDASYGMEFDDFGCEAACERRWQLVTRGPYASRVSRPDGIEAREQDFWCGCLQPAVSWREL